MVVFLRIKKERKDRILHLLDTHPDKSDRKILCQNTKQIFPSLGKMLRGEGNLNSVPPPQNTLPLPREESKPVNKSVISNIGQVDGNVSDLSKIDDSLIDDEDSDDSSNSSIYDTEDEAFSDPIPANLFPVPGQNVPAGQPIRLDVNMNHNQSSNLPLCLLFNARSIFNKSDNLTEMLHQIGPDLCIISETFERERKKIDSVLNSRHFKSISCYRKNRAPGGGCSILYHENRFSVTNLEIAAPEEIESCWAMFVPKSSSNGHNQKVKRIAVGSYYVSPRSRHKDEIIEHIISTIHQLRAKYDNDVHFLVGGDFNRLEITDILDSYGALKQIISVPTRKTALLEIILTDLHTLFHPPSPAG